MFKEKQQLLLPGPTPVPPRVLRAMSEPMINHRGPEFKKILEETTAGVKKVMQTENHVFMLTASGTGAMEAAVVNFISPGDKVLAVSVGVFGDRFAKIAQTFGADVEKLSFPMGQAADPKEIGDRLRQDREGAIKAVLITHNETSTGVLNDLEAVRREMGDHPALLIVDAVSGLAAAELKTDAWGLDVVIAGSQKAFMLPPGLSFISVGAKAWTAAEQCRAPRFYWDIRSAKKYFEKGQTPFTPAVSLFYGLREALAMMAEEGMEGCLARHLLLRDMVRAGIKALGLELLADDRCASPAVTAVKAPPGVEANLIRQIARERFNIILAGGQQTLDNKIFRIGHLGWVQPLDMIAALAAIEMTLPQVGIEVQPGAAVAAAQQVYRQRMGSGGPGERNR